MTADSLVALHSAQHLARHCSKLAQHPATPSQGPPIVKKDLEGTPHCHPPSNEHSLCRERRPARAANHSPPAASCLLCKTANDLNANAKKASIELLKAPVAEAIDLALLAKQALWNLKGLRPGQPYTNLGF